MVCSHCYGKKVNSMPDAPCVETTPLNYTFSCRDIAIEIIFIDQKWRTNHNRFIM